MTGTPCLMSATRHSSPAMVHNWRDGVLRPLLLSRIVRVCVRSLVLSFGVRSARKIFISCSSGTVLWWAGGDLRTAPPTRTPHTHTHHPLSLSLTHTHTRTRARAREETHGTTHTDFRQTCFLPQRQKKLQGRKISLALGSRKIKCCHQHQPNFVLAETSAHLVML